MDFYDILLAKKISGGGGGGSAVLINKNISANGTYNASSDNADGYKKVVVSVPNSYVAGDEGKVVSNGALVSQSSATYTANNTYDTTLVNSVTVNVSGGGGGGISVDDIAQNLQPSGAITLDDSVTQIGDYAFAGKPITSITAPSVTSVSMYALQNTSISSITDSNFPSFGVSSDSPMVIRMSSLVSIKLTGEKIALSSGSGALRDNTSLVSAEFPNCAKNVGLSYRVMGNSCFYGCKNLELVDIGYCTSIGSSAFYNAKKHITLIMRKSDALVTLGNTGNFNNSCFANGQVGGTIYIPKVLYDHLGDGTSSDYQHATNWSTIHGYGTITWAKIEGSIYE